jgi:hypothetical protein
MNKENIEEIIEDLNKRLPLGLILSSSPSDDLS